MEIEVRSPYEFENFRLDPVKRMLWRGSEPIALPPKAFDLLLALIARAARLVRKDELMDALWPDTAVEESNLTQTVFQLRRTLGESAHDHRFIVTVPGQGYRFVAAVKQAGEPPAKPHPPAPGRSLAVLPFRVVGGTPADEYLGLGIADALVILFSKTRQFTVRPTTAVLQYGKSAADPLAAGRELGVDILLHGTVQCAGNRIRITAELVSLPDNSLLWADIVDQSFADIFAAQDALSDRVSRALIHLSGAPPIRRHTQSPEAYQAYLRGRFFWYQRSAKGFSKAIQCFQSAVAKDPAYALAYAGLADCYNLLVCYGLAAPQEAWPQARDAATRALALDPQLAEAHAALALVHMGFEWNWPKAESACSRALDLDPGCIMALDYYAELLSALRQPDRSLAMIRRAQELEPLSLIVNRDVGAILYYNRRFEEAIQQLQDTLELNPDFVLARRSLACAYAQRRQFDDAVVQLEAALALSDRDLQVLAELGCILGAAGRRKEARGILAEMDQAAPRYVPPYHLALACLGAEAPGRALENLERACQSHVWQMVYLPLDPMLDPLRSSPRFDALLGRVGLAG